MESSFIFLSFPFIFPLNEVFFAQLINIVIVECGIEDLELLKEKLKLMRVLENIELHASILELLVKPEEITIFYSVDEKISEKKTKPTTKDDRSK